MNLWFAIEFLLELFMKEYYIWQSDCSMKSYLENQVKEI